MIRVQMDDSRIQGDLQEQLMLAVWRLGSGSVEEIRAKLPARYRGAYNTTQTVLNRLADRGLLTRVKAGRRYVYEPRLTEAEYLAQTISSTLATASPDARQAALAQLIGDLDDSERSELEVLAKDVALRRDAPG